MSFRKDAAVAILVFDVLYPEIQVSAEVARLYTTADHLKRMIAVLSRSLENYEKLPVDKNGMKVQPKA